MFLDSGHTCAWIVQFVHFVEIGNLCYINQIEHCKISGFFSDRIKNFVHFHASWIPIMTESNTDDLVITCVNQDHLPQSRDSYLEGE